MFPVPAWARPAGAAVCATLSTDFSPSHAPEHSLEYDRCGSRSALGHKRATDPARLRWSVLGWRVCYKGCRLPGGSKIVLHLPIHLGSPPQLQSRRRTYISAGLRQNSSPPVKVFVAAAGVYTYPLFADDVLSRWLAVPWVVKALFLCQYFTQLTG